jgi:hypothetical protein
MELCNDQDDNCDGTPDPAVGHYFDMDGDGWGGQFASFSCVAPPGTVLQPGDCDDASPQIHPAAGDECNGVDEDCDGLDGTGLDPDQDDIASDCDNCVHHANPGQQDADGDEVGDICDNCPSRSNADQANPDGDERGSACDNCPLVYNHEEDFEHDGVGDACDNCPYDVNLSQADADSDGEGDACDLDDGLILLYGPERGWIEWRAETPYASYNVYEGDLAVLRSTGVYTQPAGSNALAQRTCGLTDPFVEDADTPSAGAVQFSLVTGIAGGIESSLGNDSAGTERSNTHPCP